MRVTRRFPTAHVASAVFVALAAGTASAAPWILYLDTQSLSACDVVNAANLELVTLTPSGRLAGITGIDVVYLDTFVDANGFVYYLGQPAGTIEFAVDADGFRTLWWLTPLGDAVNVNVFTGEPTGSGVFPDEFANVPCDACPFWDVPSECLDSDGDGVVDADDFCPFTPPSELTDGFGCSCSQLDTDLDGVNDCVDLCPGTDPALVADFDGCACAQVDGDLDGVDACFDLCAGTPFNEVADANGCSCSQRDSDGDLVDDCDDLCPGTPVTATVDAFGCAVPGDGGTIVINVCGAAGMIMWTMIGFGLVGLRFAGGYSSCRTSRGRM